MEKNEIMLHGYRHLYSLHKNRRYLQDVDMRFDTLNYKLDRPLPKGKNKRLIGLMKDD